MNGVVHYAIATPSLVVPQCFQLAAQGAFRPWWETVLCIAFPSPTTDGPLRQRLSSFVVIRAIADHRDSLGVVFFVPPSFLGPLSLDVVLGLSFRQTISHALLLLPPVTSLLIVSADTQGFS